MNRSTYSLFIGDLSIYCTKEDVEKVFSAFGPISEVRIKQDENTGKNLSYGFIDYVNVTSAINVLKNMNGFVLCGRPLRIRWACNKSKIDGYPMENNIVEPQQPSVTSAVHVTYTTSQPNVFVTEETLRYLYGGFGVVVDATVKKAALTPTRSARVGFGFVHFDSSPAGVESAMKAAAAMGDVTIEGIHFKTCLSKNLEQRLTMGSYVQNTRAPVPTPYNYNMNYPVHQEARPQAAVPVSVPPQYQQPQAGVYGVPVAATAQMYHQQMPRTVTPPTQYMQPHQMETQYAPQRSFPVQQQPYVHNMAQQAPVHSQQHQDQYNPYAAQERYRVSPESFMPPMSPQQAMQPAHSQYPVVPPQHQQQQGLMMRSPEYFPAQQQALQHHHQQAQYHQQMPATHMPMIPIPHHGFDQQQQQQQQPAAQKVSPQYQNRVYSTHRHYVPTAASSNSFDSNEQQGSKNCPARTAPLTNSTVSSDAAAAEEDKTQPCSGSVVIDVAPSSCAKEVPVEANEKKRLSDSTPVEVTPEKTDKSVAVSAVSGGVLNEEISALQEKLSALRVAISDKQVQVPTPGEHSTIDVILHAQSPENCFTDRADY